jgi:hypothetical protein
VEAPAESVDLDDVPELDALQPHRIIVPGWLVAEHQAAL